MEIRLHFISDIPAYMDTIVVTLYKAFAKGALCFHKVTIYKP